jgi:hypothetical protein
MTTPSERARALRFAEELLNDILSRDKFPNLPDELRRQAMVVLRHYPDRATREEMIERDGRTTGLVTHRLLEKE